MLDLGGKTMGFSDAATSSASKGETVGDTVQVVSCYADIIAMRHPKEGAPYAAAQVGSTAAVLLETRREDGLAEGYAPNYLPVRVRTARPLGSCLNVRITGHEDGACLGEEAD